MPLSIDMEKTGANIKHCIRESGYSIREIMEITGIREIMEITGITVEQTIYKWYRGESLPSLESQLILCRLFDLPITRLLVLKENNSEFIKKDLFSQKQMQRFTAYLRAIALTA